MTETLEMQANQDMLQPNALNFLQSVYGLDQTLNELTQDEALNIAHNLTETYFAHFVAIEDTPAPPVDEQSRIRYAVQAYMSGKPLEVIAEEVPDFEDGLGVEIALHDLTHRLTYYNEALSSDANIESDLLDEVRKQETKKIAALGDIATQAFEPINSEERANQLLQKRIDRKAAAAEKQMQAFADTKEFKRAAAQKGHNIDVEVFLVSPEDEGEEADTLREMSWLISQAVFLDKDGTPMSSMRAQEDIAQDYHMVAVKHTAKGPVPVGSMYVKLQKPGDVLPSLKAIEKTWEQPLEGALQNANLPDLRTEPNVLDIVTVGVLKEFQKSGANVGMYNMLGLLSKKLNTKHFVTIFDEGPAKSLNKFDNGFEKYADENIIPPKCYDAPRGNNANKSLPLYCDIASWHKRLRTAAYGILFGDSLASRIKLTNLWNGRLPIEQAPEAKLAPQKLFERHDKDRKRHDEPIIYLDLDVITESFDEFDSFPENTKVHYAMKCNPNKRVLQHLRSLGSRFEIASYAELQLLRKSGLKRTEVGDVLFSNPVKSAKDIQAAYKAGVRRFAFQSEDELAKLARYAPGASVYLRLATPLDASAVASESKFGQPSATADEQAYAVKLMKQAQSLGLNPYGLAFHVGSQMENPNAWDQPLENAVAVARQLEALGINISMLDIGGGFPAYHDARIPPIKAFGKAITKKLAALDYQPKELVVEPGRALVSDAGAMVAEVYGKAKRDGKNWLYLSVGAFNGMMESLETRTKLGYPMVDERGDSLHANYVVTGPSCDGQDTISSSQLLSPGIQQGDRIIIYTTGAYTAAYASSFNGFKPAIIKVIGGDSSAGAIRKGMRRFKALAGAVASR